MEQFELWTQPSGLCETVPMLDYYPAQEKKTDATVIICPGGAYQHLAPHEGMGYAEFFNSIGMDAFVCQYRVSPHRFPLPLLDVRRAIRFVRANAERFGIDPNKVAVMGSSAGGHLAALVSNYDRDIDGEGQDETDRYSARPDATILCYPVIQSPDEQDANNVGHVGSFRNLLGTTEPELCRMFSCDRLVSEQTPPAFLWHTAQDAGVNVINSYLYAAALRRNQVPCEMHIFPAGPHGLGLAKKNPHVAQWVPLLVNWLRFLGWVEPEKAELQAQQ